MERKVTARVQHFQETTTTTIVIFHRSNIEMDLNGDGWANKRKGDAARLKIFEATEGRSIGIKKSTCTSLHAPYDCDVCSWIIVEQQRNHGARRNNEQIRFHSLSAGKRRKISSNLVLKLPVVHSLISETLISTKLQWLPDCCNAASWQEPVLLSRPSTVRPSK